MSRKNNTVEKFFSLTTADDRTKLLNSLRKEISLNRRFFVSTADVADIILSPSGILDICHRFNVHVGLDSHAPGYAVRYVMCREKAKNLVYAAALVRGASIPGLKAALGTKGSMVLNEATNIAKKMCAPALETIDKLYHIDINEKIRSDEYLSIYPSVKVSLGDTAPDSISGISIRLEELGIELLASPAVAGSKVYLKDDADINGLTKGQIQKRALWLREKFIIQRLLSYQNDGKGEVEVIFNNSMRHSDMSKKRIAITYATTDSASHFKNNPVVDNKIDDIFASSITSYSYDTTDIPIDLGDTEFNEWRVGAITIAELLYFAKHGQYAAKYGTDIFDISCLGIAAFVPCVEVDTNDLVLLLSSTTLNRHVSASLTYTLNQLYNNPEFSHDSLKNVIRFYGTKYKYNLISFKDIVHFKKNDGTVSYSAEILHQSLTASSMLHVTFTNVADVYMKSKENGDVLNSFEMGDTEKIEEAIVAHNESSSVSFAYHGQFVSLAADSNQKHHKADTAISDQMIANLHNDKYLLANMDTKITYKPGVRVQKKRIIRNSGGIILETTNPAQYKLSEGVLTAKVIGEKSNVMEEFVKIGDRETIELITLEAMYHEGKDHYQEVSSFANAPVTRIDHADMDTISFATKLNFNSLSEMYSKYINGTAYGANYNTTMPNVVRTSNLFGGTSVGTIINCSVMETMSTTEPFFLLEGMNFNTKAFKISINHFELDKGNGELENISIAHAGTKYQQRIATILNLYIDSVKVDIVPLDNPVEFELKVKDNYKILDFLKLKYFKKIDMDVVAFDLSYKFIGIADERLALMSREYSNIAITSVIYKLLKAEAITVISQISHLRYFFRVFTTDDVFNYLDAHVIQTHIQSYSALLISKTESEKLVLHSIILNMIRVLIRDFDANDGKDIVKLMEKQDAGTISKNEISKLHTLLVSNNAALWSKEMGAYFDVPSALHDVMGQI